MSQEEAKNTENATGQQTSGWPSSDGLEETILESVRNRCFLSTIQRLSLMARDAPVRQQTLNQLLIRLHNAKQIDLLAELGQIGKEPPDSKKHPDFLVLIYDLREVFPQLETPLEALCRLFAGFDHIGNGDMGWWESLSPRFMGDVDSRLEMVRLAESNAEYWQGLVVAFEAGLSCDAETWIEKAASFLECPQTRTKVFFNAILTAISNQYMFLAQRGSPERFWNVFESSVENDNPCFDWAVAFSICHAARKVLPIAEQQNRILHRILAKNDPRLLQQVAMRVAIDHATTDVKELEESFSALSRIDPKAETGKNLVFSLNRLLSALIRAGYVDLATKFLTSYVLRWKVSPKVFEGTIETLQQLQPKQSGQIMTAWFLSQNRSLEKFAAAVAPIEIGETRSPEIALDQLTSTQITFPTLVAKFIGYLFYTPQTMIRFVFPCLDLMDEDDKTKVARILYDPVVLSYENYIRKWMCSDECCLKRNSRNLLEALLDRGDRYHDKFKDSVYCPELTPPLEQRKELAAIREEAAQASYKESMKRSILNIFGPPISLLHGDGMILYIDRGNGNLERIEKKLERHSVSLVYPSLPDSIGRDFQWRLALLKMGELNIDPALDLIE